mmetsp:Transcript_56777/g.112928  ORF Transcript_56777/g.112928 Transcript_56777/m.112928 type:complete len:200 (-) Transcript_56777:263-862(-)
MTMSTTARSLLALNCAKQRYRSVALFNGNDFGTNAAMHLDGVARSVGRALKTTPGRPSTETLAASFDATPDTEVFTREATTPSSPNWTTMPSSQSHRRVAPRAINPRSKVRHLQTLARDQPGKKAVDRRSARSSAKSPAEVKLRRGRVSSAATDNARAVPHSSSQRAQNAIPQVSPNASSTMATSASSKLSLPESALPL